MPKYPIYVNLLSEEAQEVIGQVHDNTRPAIELLKSEGFTFNGYVDIFDAGPTVEAKVDNIRTVRSASYKTVTIGDNLGGSPVIIANDKLQGYRATVAELQFDENSESVVVSAKLAKALNLVDGDKVSIATI
jgi:arginine N-succinyltransferase